MKVLQPIEWHDVDGNKFQGIVTADLGKDQGVLARSTAEPAVQVSVAVPHKIRDTQTMMSVWESMGITPHSISRSGVTTMDPVAKQIQPEPAAFTEVQAKSAFDRAMQEIDDMFSPIASKGFRDKLFLNSMGFNFVEGALPEPEKD